jgi:hypothetical protein
VPEIIDINLVMSVVWFMALGGAVVAKRSGEDPAALALAVARWTATFGMAGLLIGFAIQTLWFR